ncbi:MAG: multifunctional tRNA nucleotidyl transferase/23-cyclic [Burkholderiales bacterium]|nr:multifunctional tRNA nucleotidyl transferase/23-cyclic [Burkholderiales bacterium]
MKVYRVGGAVRDELLGLPVKERDYVVVGATPEEMVSQGFRPVGKDFPVFLHPQTHEEYALARTERKSGRGYKGFTVYASPEVTLEEDLRRRDLTINAIAKAEDGTLIDPFGGQDDLRSKILKHVSDAFAEDPVRILRVARFAARFGFEVDASTMEMMKRMVDSGEADYLVPERVWQEFAKGLAEPHPERMFEVLDRCGLLAKAFPEIRGWPKRFSGSVPVRFAHLAWGLNPDSAEALCERLRAPNEVRELALTAARNRELMKRSDPRSLLQLLKGADAFRRPERFAELLEAARLADPSGDTARIERALQAAAGVDAGAIARSAQGGDIGRLVDEARLKAIRSLG